MPDTETLIFVCGAVALAWADQERRDGHRVWMAVIGLSGIALMATSVYLVHISATADVHY